MHELHTFVVKVYIAHIGMYNLRFRKELVENSHLIQSYVCLSQLYMHPLFNLPNNWCLNTIKPCFCVMKWSHRWQFKCPLHVHKGHCFQWWKPHHLLWRCPFGLVFKCQLHLFSPEKRGEQHKWQVIVGRICPPCGRRYSIWLPHQPSTTEVVTSVAFVSPPGHDGC